MSNYASCWQHLPDLRASPVNLSRGRYQTAPQVDYPRLPYEDPQVVGEKVVEEVGGEGDEVRGRAESGREGICSRKLTKLRGGRREKSDERVLPIDGPSGGHEVHLPHRSGESSQQPALSARGVPSQVQSLAEESRTYLDRRVVAVF